jgi:hypothetical protein
MVDLVGDWFQGFATIGGWLYFLAGFAAAYAVECAKAKLRHRRVRLPWRLAGIAIGLSVMVVVTVQTQVSYTTSKKAALTAQQVAVAQAECNRQFWDALRARAAIAKENDDLSEEQRFAIFEFLHDIALPPPPFNTMATDDPRRSQYGLKRLLDTQAVLRRSIDRQNELQDYRDAHPLPDPTCGK